MQVRTVRENIAPVKSAGKISAACKAWKNTQTNAIAKLRAGVTRVLNKQWAFSDWGTLRTGPHRLRYFLLNSMKTAQ